MANELHTYVADIKECHRRSSLGRRIPALRSLPEYFYASLVVVCIPFFVFGAFIIVKGARGMTTLSPEFKTRKGGVTLGL